MGESFSVETIDKKGPIQVIRILDSQIAKDLDDFMPVIYKIRDKITKDTPIVLDFIDGFPAWAQAMLLLNLEMNVRWVGIRRRAAYTDYSDVIIVSSNIGTFQIGNALSPAMLGIEP